MPSLSGRLRSGKVVGMILVHRGESAFREQHLLAFFAELRKCLRARDFVAEVEPDKELALAARELSYRVAFKNLLIE